MPLSGVCVSVVSSRPRRTWSSSNIPSKDVHNILNMNSAEDIATYNEPPFHSPHFNRRTLGCSYDFPEKTYKKDKKWSLTNIFRRKKKEDSETSSEEDAQKKSFLGRRKKKSDTKRKKPSKSAPFDHVVLQPGSRNSYSYNSNYQEDFGIMSDPTSALPNYVDRALPQIPSQKLNKTTLNESFSGSVDSVRKSRREQAMARAEARRNSSKNGSSSEDESHKSNSSIKIHSEENLKNIHINKRSRSARTERYLKRHSRDGENPHNYLRIYKSDAENWKYSDESNRSPSRSPLIPQTLTPNDTKHKLSHSSLNSHSSNISGLSTIPPSHGMQNKYKVSNSTSNPNYKPPQSMNDYNNSIKKYANNFGNDQRSISCDDNIHKTYSPEVLHVQFPVMKPKRGFRNLSLIDTSQLPNMRHPPPPPPRDPNRTIPSNYFESRPNSFYLENFRPNNKHLNYSNSYQEPIKKKTFNLHPNYRSTSEDHLARNVLSIPQETRPSSTTPESNKPQKLTLKKEEPKSIKDEFNYLTDKKPRSRKPIFIQSGTKANTTTKDTDGTNKALNFWKEIDRQNLLSNQSIPKSNRTPSPQMFSSHTQVQTKIFIPNVTQNEAKKETLTIPKETLTIPKETNPSSMDAVTKEDIKRKSCNLEEALNELEAIYNSLKLGDEDLLERAEQKEKEMLAKRLEASNTFPSSVSKGALSDSSFTYEPFDTVDSPRRKKLSKKTHNLKLDDMAFRKINKDRANTIGDPQSVVSQVSYLMRSPVFSRNHVDQNTKDNTNEPDITLDDVVYRNVKHSNSLLKVVEPQPPFGIPLGPITPGANSDYLHAKPELIYKPSYKHKKIPDIVKDDLAFRNLRKDANKGPALPPLSNEDFSNNNAEANLKYLKKKRAQRSMSANIGNILNTNGYNNSNAYRNNEDVENHFKTLTDIADAMEIARKVLKEKENKISATKKAFMSDTDANYHNSASSTKENRLNFLNELRGSVQSNDYNKSDIVKRTSLPRNLSPPKICDYLSPNSAISDKPPRGLTPERRRSPKESTPIPVSPLEDKRSIESEESTPSSFDDLLNALAEEAKETTERITKELTKLSEEKEKYSQPTPSKSEDVLNKRLSEIDEVSEKAKLCDKLLQNVVDSKNLITVLKNVGEDEEVASIHEVPVNPESATIVMSRFETRDDTSKSNESEHDYENLTSDIEVTLEISDDNERKCLSPFEEHKAELIASFQELKESADNENTKETTKINSVYDNLESMKDDSAVTGEEECDSVLELVALPYDAFSLNTNSVDQIFTSNCDIVLRKLNVHDDEVSSGFHSCGESSHYLKSDSNFDLDAGNNLDSLESLKSPKLVLETVAQNDLPKSSKLVMQCIKSDDNGKSANNLRGRNDIFSQSRVDVFNDNKKPSASWYRDPTSMAFACSYGLACAHQLANVDLFAVLSILFAVLTFIAALFL